MPGIAVMFYVESEDARYAVVHHNGAWKLMWRSTGGRAGRRDISAEIARAIAKQLETAARRQTRPSS